MNYEDDFNLELDWKPGARAAALHRGDVVAVEDAGARDDEEDAGVRMT